MGFDVQITDEAFGDLDVITEFVTRQASIGIARKWFDGIIVSIETLEEMPMRCPLAPEAEDLKADIRLLLHGRRTGPTRFISRSTLNLNQAVQ